MTRRTPILTALLLVLTLGLAACGKGPAEKAAAHRQRADAYLAQGKVREASIEYQAALQELPNDPESLYGLARCLETIGRPGEYRNTLERVVRAKPDHPGACADLAGIRWAEGRFAEALEFANRALAGNPENLGARKIAARSLLALGRVDEARAAWAKVLDAVESDEAFVEAATLEVGAGDPERAAELLARGAERFPRGWRTALAQADLFSLLGRWEEAEAAVARAEAVAPDEPRVVGARARLLLRGGKVQEALDTLARAQEARAADPEAAAAVARERARILVGLGGIRDAEGVLRGARNLAPADPELAADLAYVLLLQGRADEARPLIQKTWGADPSGRTPRLLEAWSYLLDGRSHWALQVLEVLVARGDMSVDTHLLYARALMDVDRLAKARSELEAILRRVPDHVFARLDLAGVLLRQREYEKALAVLEGLPPSVRTAPQAQYLRARILLGRGDLEAARRLAAEFLKAAPENTAVQMLAGDVARARTRWSEALRHYEKAQELSPRSPFPLFARAEVLEVLGRRREAKELYETWLAQVGEDPLVLNRLAGLLMAEGRPGEALQRVERSLLLEPNYWASRYLRARILLAQGNETQAMVDLEEAARLNPVQPEPYNLLASLYAKRGDAARAEETYRRHLDQKPDDPLTLNNLAYLLLEGGRVDEALDLAARARRAAPRSPVVADTLGWALHLAGRREEAAPLLAEARRALGENPDVLLHWAANQEALGNAEDARKALARVVELAPDSAAAAEAARLLGKAGSE